MYLHKHWNVFTLIEELVNWLQKQTRRFCAASIILGTSLLLIQFFGDPLEYIVFSFSLSNSFSKRRISFKIH